MMVTELKGLTISADNDMELKSTESEFYDCEIEQFKKCGMNHGEWLPVTYIAGFAMRGKNHKNTLKNVDGYFLIVQKK